MLKKKKIRSPFGISRRPWQALPEATFRYLEPPTSYWDFTQLHIYLLKIFPLLLAKTRFGSLKNLHAIPTRIKFFVQNIFWINNTQRYFREIEHMKMMEIISFCWKSYKWQRRALLTFSLFLRNLPRILFFSKWVIGYASNHNNVYGEREGLSSNFIIFIDLKMICRNTRLLMVANDGSAIFLFLIMNGWQEP